MQPTATLVERMAAAAGKEPSRAIAFQGAPGANSHIAVNQAFPASLPLPCISFEDAIDAVRERRAERALIPIENSLHGRVADMHFCCRKVALSLPMSISCRSVIA